MEKMTAAALLCGIGDARQRPELENIIITGVQTDSRKVVPGIMGMVMTACRQRSKVFYFY